MVLACENSCPSEVQYVSQEEEGRTTDSKMKYVGQRCWQALGHRNSSLSRCLFSTSCGQWQRHLTYNSIPRLPLQHRARSIFPPFPPRTYSTEPATTPAGSKTVTEEPARGRVAVNAETDSAPLDTVFSDSSASKSTAYDGKSSNTTTSDSSASNILASNTLASDTSTSNRSTPDTSASDTLANGGAVRVASVSAVPAQSASQSAQATHQRGDVPAYEMTFTCRKCDTRSTHRVSKQGYYKGSVLIMCPGCKFRHLISDHLKIFSEKAVTLEDILREKGQLVRRGALNAEGDVEFWDDQPSKTTVT